MVTITIQTTDGPCEIPADVFGAWAVHRPSQTNGPGWHVTHVASGTRIPDGYLEGAMRSIAIDTEAIQIALFEEELRFIAKLNHERYTRFALAWRDIAVVCMVECRAAGWRATP